MSKQADLPGRVSVSRPCAADWDSMIGNDRVRFCEHCAQSVNNLSEMTRKDVTRLLASSRGRLCVRYYTRPDGAIQTAPRRLHQIGGRASRVAAGAFTAALSLCANVAAQTASQTPAPAAAQHQLPPGVGHAGMEARGGSAALEGTIFDPHKAVIPGAEVTLVNEQTEVERPTTSDEDGAFRFRDLEAGLYTLRIAPGAGFAGFEQEHVSVSEGTWARVDATLNPADVVMGGIGLPSATLPLVRAAQEGDIAAVKQQLAAGADVAARDADTNSTALDEAAGDGNAETVKLLLRAGADPNAANREGRTALMRVYGEGAAEVVRLLTDAGANPNARDEDGDTALIAAASWGEAEIVRALIEAGADVNAANDEGDTPLMRAAAQGRLDNVTALLDTGADMNKKDKEGATALKRAVEGEHAEVVALLKARGAFE